MMSKVRNALFFGAGYILGAQAGRARYEELKQQAARLLEHPRTQQLTGRTRELVASRLPSRLSRHGSGGSAAPAAGATATTTTEPDVPLSEPTVAARTMPDDTIDLTQPGSMPSATWQGRP